MTEPRLPALEALARFMYERMMTRAKARGIVTADYHGSWALELEGCREDYRWLAGELVHNSELLLAEAYMEQLLERHPEWGPPLSRALDAEPPA